MLDILFNEEEINSVHCLLGSNVYLLIQWHSRSCVMKFNKVHFFKSKFKTCVLLEILLRNTVIFCFNTAAYYYKYWGFFPDGEMTAERWRAEVY